ncbi:MAG: hypothetical protein ACRDCW_00710 [Sarcina sp.]
MKTPTKEELKKKFLANTETLESILKLSDTPSKTKSLHLLLHKIIYKVTLFENKSIEVIFK